MSGRSARNYWTDDQLDADARYNRGRADEYMRRARTEQDARDSLRQANACLQRAIASEAILRRRRLDAEQVARFK